MYICIYIFIILNKGPMTYTSEDGTTTLYGVVSMSGARTTKVNRCQVNMLMARVSAPSILNWIKSIITKYA